MAHGFLQSFDDNLTVCSAGTEASGKLNRKAVEVMNEIGIDISHHTSDSVEKYLKDEWDYVILFVVVPMKLVRLFWEK